MSLDNLVKSIYNCHYCDKFIEDDFIAKIELCRHVSSATMRRSLLWFHETCLKAVGGDLDEWFLKQRYRLQNFDMFPCSSCRNIYSEMISILYAGTKQVYFCLKCAKRNMGNKYLEVAEKLIMPRGESDEQTEIYNDS